MKKAMLENQEKEFVAAVTAQIESRGMTITNTKEAMGIVYQQLEDNSTVAADGIVANDGERYFLGKTSQKVNDLIDQSEKVQKRIFIGSEMAKQQLSRSIEIESHIFFGSILKDCKGLTVNQMRVHSMKAIRESDIEKEVKYAIKERVDEYVGELIVGG